MITSPVFKPARAAAWLPVRSSGDQGEALPTTAVLVPSGRRFEVAPGSTLAPSDNLSHYFIMHWARIDSRPQRYTVHLSHKDGQYVFFGVDSLAGSGSDRNLAYYAQVGGGLGGHAIGGYGSYGVWRHVCFSVYGTTFKCWFDGVAQTWDSTSSETADVFDSTWEGVTTLNLLNESGWADQDYVGGVRAMVIGRKTAGHLETADVVAAMARSQPFVTGGAAESGFYIRGCWPLTTSADLTNAISGGPALSLFGGALGADTTGPAGITLP